MSRPPHPPWFNHPNFIRWRLQAVKFIIMQFSPWSIFLPFRSKYPPQHSVLKKPSGCVPPSKCEYKYDYQNLCKITFQCSYLHLDSVLLEGTCFMELVS
jgi:hypothetical protein